MKPPQIKDWVLDVGVGHLFRYVFAGDYTPGHYQGKKITDAKMKAKRRRQMERGFLRAENGASK